MESTHEQYILPDTPPQQEPSFPSYWAVQAARKKKIPSTSAAPPAAVAAASDPEESPLKRRGVFVERGMSSDESIIPDTPPSHLGWAPKRVPLTTITTNRQQGKRKLQFLEEEEEETNFVPSKKRMSENTSMALLLEEAAVRDDDDDDNDEDLIALINKPSPKPWMPLRELVEDVPHTIISVREETNHHGRRIILKINIASTKKISEVYLPQRFSSIISPCKVVKFNSKCKNLGIVVKHITATWSDIKIVKM
ncbi:uncharacterized protein LOC120355057 [Nilaparvata lugens]|uniref:uncharacterized protein LOC120355057 n=1 Tax=Nilaparvata lugens TaxID=108931 RepID=UPI00193C88C1|nr:uncharacterized protein LOC120355057 [Nilaparvata lugens]